MTKNSSHCLRTTGFLVILFNLFLLLYSESFANGPILGARSTGMGTAFTAVADDPSTIAVNPAGLTQITGTEVYGGTTFIIPSTEYTSTTGKTEETTFQVFFPPHLYVSSDIGLKDLRVGIGIFSPFGVGGRKWDGDGLTRYSSVKNTIATVSINPTIAYQVLPSLSIGFGVNYMLSKMEAEKKINQSALSAGDGRLSMDGLGDGWGYDVGILFIPDKRISLGLAYRSRIKITHKGDMHFNHIAPQLQPLFGGSQFKTDIETPSTFPDIVSAGIAYRPTDKLTVALAVEKVGWSSFKNAEIDFEKEVPQAGFTDSSTPLDWKDSWVLEVGAEYKANERLSLRGGYVHVPTPVPEKTLDAANPDSNQHNFCVGFGYKLKTIVLDFFYVAGFFEDRKVHNTILSGTYENFTHYAGFSIGKKF
jgi:long-chain fatty acid transport protein